MDVPVDDDDFDIWVVGGKETLNLFAFLFVRLF